MLSLTLAATSVVESVTVDAFGDAGTVSIGLIASTTCGVALEAVTGIASLGIH